MTKRPDIHVLKKKIQETLKKEKGSNSKHVVFRKLDMKTKI